MKRWTLLSGSTPLSTALMVSLAVASLVVPGCRPTPTVALYPFPNPVERVRYTPPPEFYTETCSDASDRVSADLGRLEIEMDPGDTDDFIGALRSRLDECQSDIGFRRDYLNLLEIGGWHGTYNRVLAEYKAQFPGGTYPPPLPDSAYVPEPVQP